MKRIISIFLTVFLVLIFSETAFATDENENITEVMDELSKQIEEGTDDEIIYELENEGIDIKDPATVTNIKTESLFDKIISVFSANIGNVIKIVAKITALVILCTIVKNYVPDNFGGYEVFSLVSVICTTAIVISTLQNCMDVTLNAINRISTFMTCYIPVFSSVIITSGSVTAGTAYYVVMFSVCEGITFISKNFIMPVMSLVLALSIVGALNPEIAFVKVATGLKKAVQWVMGIAMTVVVAVLSIQSVIGVSTDTVATRTARYAVSTFVPVVGGAVSEAFMTVKSSVEIIRSGIGGIGIIILLFIVIQPIVSIAVSRLGIMICELIADMFEEKAVASLMSSISSVLSICLSTVICVSITFLISTALLLLLGTNIA